MEVVFQLNITSINLLGETKLRVNPKPHDSFQCFIN